MLYSAPAIPYCNRSPFTLSTEFRELLKKVGSGPHTGKNLSRAEAERALDLMLNQTATPAQIGAFLIAHRIKRPTGEELAGILDAFDAFGPIVPAIDHSQPVVVLSNPYDGRSRTAPISPITSLILATAGCPVLMHGGNCMPTKYGIPLMDVWNALGVDWQNRSLTEIQACLATHNLGFVYLSDHFPLAQALVPFRDQLGKRPPLATAELLWCPYAGESRLFSGYVHPPTEGMLQDAFAHRGTQHYTTIKGLEGSIDLPRDRTAIIGIHHPDEPELERLFVNARDFQLGGLEIPYESPETLQIQMQQVLAGEPSILEPAVLWNGGFYLWHQEFCPSLEAGIEQTRSWLKVGKVQQTLTQLIQFLQR